MTASAAPPLLILTTKNRNNGDLETALLAYQEDGNSYVVAASNDTERHKPDWYLNLKEEPQVELDINGTSVHAHATTPVGTDRLKIWPLVESIAKPKEVIPRDTTVVVLTPD